MSASSTSSIDSIGWDPTKILAGIVFVSFSVLYLATGSFLIPIATSFCVLLSVPWILIKSTMFQRKLIFHTWYYTAEKSLDNPASFGVKNAVNMRVGGLGTWHVPHQTNGISESPFAAQVTVVYCHGSSGTRGNDYRVNLVNHLSSLGCAVYIFDYRGYGDSPGEPSEEHCVQDALEVVAEARREYPTDKIVLFGHSMGTGVACQTAYKLRKEGCEVDGTILEAPFLSIPDSILDSPVCRFLNRLPLYCGFVWRIQDPFLSRNVIGELGTVLILFAENDEVVHSHHAVDLHRLCKNSTLHLIPEGGHNFLINQDSVKRAIREHLEVIVKQD